MLHGWHDLFGSNAVMMRDVLARVAKRGPGGAEFMEVLVEASGEGSTVNGNKLGQYLLRHCGHRVDGLRLAKAPKTRNVVSWRVESVVAVESVLVVPLVETESAPVTPPAPDPTV